MIIVLLLFLQQVGALYFQTYGGTIDGMACVDSSPSTVTFPSFTFSAPTASQSGSIGIRQIAFQRIGYGFYDNQGITLNGVSPGAVQNCCTATSCEAAVQYQPWQEGECGLSWCGTENHWEYIDFTGTSPLIVPQNTNLTLALVNPMAIVDNFGSPILAMSYDVIPASITLSSTLSMSSSESFTPTPTSSITPSESLSSTSTSSIIPSESLTPTSTSSITPSESLTPTSTSSITPSESITSTSTSSMTPTPSITPSESITPTSTSSITPTSSITASITPTLSITSSVTSSDSSSRSITATQSRFSSESKTRSPSSSSSVSPSKSPSGICYSVSTLYGTAISLSDGWIIVNTGINVTQAYGSGYISMGNFVGCSVIGNTCKCSYTQGSTVAGCGGKRNSYITYSYGAINSITYTNESPTCSYNFAGMFAIPSSGSVTPSLTRSSTVSPSKSVSTQVSISISSTVSSSFSRSPSISPSSSITTSPTNSVSPTTSLTPTPSSTTTVSLTPSRTPTRTLTKTQSRSSSISPSISRTVFESVSISSSGTLTDTSSPSWNSSKTSTPLYYITQYPSSSATDHGTVTPTPLFMITPWPSNGTGTVSSTPLFMRIYYPSITPVINYTYSYEPERAVTVVVAGIGVGIVSIATLGFLAYYVLTKGMSMKPPGTSENNNNRQQGGDDTCKIQISSSDLKEIEELLIQHRKEYRVLGL